MKVYHQNGNKIKVQKRGLLYALLAAGSVVVIALIVALAVLSGSPSSGKDNTGLVTTRPTEYVLPFNDYTVVRKASIDELVYMPSINMWKTHNGVDFTADGDEKVKVMADGVVKSAEQSSLEGWVIAVDHGDGIISYYKSLESALVKAGDSVKAGDEIGTAGVMITESDVGKHVHIEMTKGGKIVDPLDYLDTDSTK